MDELIYHDYKLYENLGASLTIDEKNIDASEIAHRSQSRSGFFSIKATVFFISSNRDDAFSLMEAILERARGMNLKKSSSLLRGVEDVSLESPSLGEDDEEYHIEEEKKPIR